MSKNRTYNAIFAIIHVDLQLQFAIFKSLKIRVNSL